MTLMRERESRMPILLSQHVGVFAGWFCAALVYMFLDFFGIFALTT
jgi:hypothetical protein